ncbi:MAG: prepilin-type N-terminal cleavage/methylation domain-containing protein [Spongiibacteraceae bacterium]|jgi:prepilin-type N-terminal cleavage/methylation domain-containing protein
MMIRQNQGFTLLEMVVVLVLVGVVTGLVLPGLQRMYDSLSLALDRDELVAQLSSLALQVRHSGRDSYFAGYNPDMDMSLQALPEGFKSYISSSEWQMAVDDTILITAAGFCPVGGRVKVSRGEKTFELYLRSPDCKARIP